MELHPAAGLTASRDAVSRYCARLVRRTCAPRPAACANARSLHELHGVLGSRDVGAEPAQASLSERLRFARIARSGRAHPPLVEDARRGVCLLSTPPIRRSPMAPQPWSGRRLFRRRRAVARGPVARGRWHRTAAWRRTTLLVLVLAQTALATAIMADVLPYHGTRPLEIALLVLFAILTGWISAGFWTAMAGFLLLLRGRDRHALRANRAPADIDPHARTAIVVPICNEDVARVFAGVRATYESVRRAGALDAFDFFILSDSGDADLRVAERAAWLDLCRRSNAFGRVFYRLRAHRIKRKSGNIADFCRRWGCNYRYMVVFDADSVMSGDCLAALVRLMEANPDTGMIQTAPHASGRDTLYTRIQQFAGNVYGPLFVAGMHYWQLGEAHYWGHNAIIRVAPFIAHCALARLPGRGTLSGEILSHDFVEAALMRRAGWGVWIAYDLTGSYEEMPPNLIDELKRDRRWCQGNLINSRLFFAHGLHPAHRAVFVTGVMAYASAPLWFSFLVLSTIVLAVHTLVAPQYFTAPNQLFPLWPQWHPARAIGLFEAIAVLLFLPKLCGVALAARRSASRFGGSLRLAASALLEAVFSALLAPIRMLFHTQFVAAAFAGRSVAWKSPPRGDNETHWREALRRHGVHTLIGLGWAAFVFWLNPAFLLWLLPVAGALMLSIPLSALSSRVSLGRRSRAARLFLIPEETKMPRVLRDMRRYLTNAPDWPDFVAAVVDPLDNAIACATEHARMRLSAALRAENAALAERALVDGPDALSNAERNALLGDANALARLHFAVWTRRDAHERWQLECRRDVAPPISRRRGDAAHAAPTAAAVARAVSCGADDRALIRRRDFLAAAATIASVPLLVRAAHNGGDPADAPFDYAWLKGHARALAARDYEAAPVQAPPALANLDWDHYQAIRFRPERALWADQALPFRITFFHLGLNYRRAVRMHVVEHGWSTPIAYAPALFDLTRAGLDAAALAGVSGFAGFRVHFRSDFTHDIAAFLGASYFRAVGATGQYGLSARGLTVDCGMSRPEEFPDFTAFWFERPAAGATSLELYALLDSPSVTGAYRFEVTPAATQVMRIDAALYPRRAIERLGVAPLTSMFLCAPNDRRVGDDWRPAIHDSDGLAMWRGNGEWIWRPLVNPATVRVNAFTDAQPHGFGLLQRDRNFDHYQDDGVFYDRRPSAWVEPLSGFADGAVQLVEIPAGDETADNIVAFWRPQQPVSAGQELLYAYRLSWGSQIPAQPPLAHAATTWTGVGGIVGHPRDGTSTRFVVDFAGGELARLDRQSPVEAIVSASRGKLELISARPLDAIRGWRAMFDLRPPPGSHEVVDLRLFLRIGGRALSETWLYQWTPKT